MFAWSNRCIVLFALLGMIQAAFHYCESDTTLRMDLSMNPNQVERIFPEIDSRFSCRWAISASGQLSLDSSVVVLGAFDANKMPRRRWSSSIQDSITAKIHYQLVDNRGTEGETGECSTSHDAGVVTENMFRVLQLQKGSYLSITYQQNSSQVSRLPPGLKVHLVEKDFCSREMVNFEQSCYAISPSERSLLDELRTISGDSKIMRLATFSSMEQIRGFVRASRKRIAVIDGSVRGKKPLDLSRAVRIGLFYDEKSRSMKFLNVSGDQCKLQDVLDEELLSSMKSAVNGSSACGSLRVESQSSGSNKILVEFGDCSERLAALISFDESPRTRCSNCTRPVAEWLEAAAADAGGDSGQELLLPKRQRLFSVVILTSVAALLLIVVTIVMAVCFLRRIRKRVKAPCPNRRSHCGVASSNFESDVLAVRQ